MTDRILRENIERSIEVHSRLMAACLPAMVAASDALFSAFHGGHKALFFGNGGSAALASHCACDFGKGTSVNHRRPFRVIALTDNVPLITAWANDSGYEDIFTGQLRSLILPRDIAFAISGSGNSPNVLNALTVAREMGCFNISLTGFQGGRVKALSDLCIVVPSDNMQHIEDSHVCVMHSIFTALRQLIERSAGNATQLQRAASASA